MIYLLTAVGLSPGGSTHLHTNNTQNNTNNNSCGRVRAVPRLCEFYTGICLATEKKARENLSQGKKNLSEVKKNLNQSTVHILPKHPHITKLTHTHTIIFPKINYNLMKLYSYFNLKAVHPLVLTVETEIVFRLSYYTSGQLGSMFIILPVSSAVCLLHFRSARQYVYYTSGQLGSMFISMLAQQHSTSQHNKDVGPSIDTREESALCLLFGISCFVTTCYSSHHIHVEGRQPSCVEELHFIITLRGFVCSFLFYSWYN